MSFVRNRYRDDCAQEFEGTLQELMRRGYVLSITGIVSETVTLQAIRRLSGDPQCDRKRVLVATGRSEVDITDGLPPGAKRNGSNIRVVRPSDAELDDRRGTTDGPNSNTSRRNSSKRSATSTKWHWDCHLLN
jgi:hypothetical protein